MNRAITILSVLLIALCTAAVRAETTQPQPPGQGPGVQLRRLGENLSKLDLTPEQQDKTKALVEDMMTRLRELKENAKPGDRPMAKVGEIMSDARGKLTEILTPEQQAKLRELTEQQRADQARRESDAAKPRPPEPEKKVEPKPEPEKKQEAKVDPPAKTKVEPPAVSKVEPKKAELKAPEPKPALPKTEPVAAAPSTVEVGADAPAFTLKTTTDKVQALSAYKGKVVVLVFGSYTCPVFRDKLAAMEKLYRDEQLKSVFLVVYTREAHAIGEWEVERNKAENIQIEQPKTDAERRDLAKQTVNTLKITVPVLVDGIDDAVSKAYGLTPNGTVVIGRDGRIAAKQQWFEPTALRGMIDAAAMVHNPTN